MTSAFLSSLSPCVRICTSMRTPPSALCCLLALCVIAALPACRSSSERSPAPKDEEAPVAASAEPSAVKAPERSASQGASPQLKRDELSGLITVRVEGRSVEQAYSALRAAIERHDKLEVMAEINHAENAEDAKMTLSPSRVILFGNPALGTPLMQRSPTFALDLPQRVLLYEPEEGGVAIVYNDPMFLAKRHGIEGEDERLNQIAQALKELAMTAAGQSEAP